MWKKWRLILGVIVILPTAVIVMNKLLTSEFDRFATSLINELGSSSDPTQPTQRLYEFFENKGIENVREYLSANMDVFSPRRHVDDEAMSRMTRRTVVQRGAVFLEVFTSKYPLVPVGYREFRVGLFEHADGSIDLIAFTFVHGL